MIKILKLLAVLPAVAIAIATTAGVLAALVILSPKERIR